MEPYRERFRVGYEKYAAGAVGEALQYWEPIYRELGPERGYRLSYDIARAYETLGDATRAAERFESFLGEAKARRERGEALEELVLREEAEAREHLDRLVHGYGRVRVAPTTPAETVRIDASEPRLAGFVAFVPPGRHTVTFAPGTKDEERREMDVAAGELVDVAPAPKAVAPPPPPPPVREVHEAQRPYAAGWIFAAGGLALASVLAPVIAYSVAQSQLGAIRLEQQKPAEQQADAGAQIARINGYYAARTTAYATLAVPLVLAAGTAGLAFGWVFGAKEVVRVVPTGAGAAVTGTFGGL